MDSLMKGWFVTTNLLGYENVKVKNLLQRAQTYNMLSILRVEIPTQTVQVREKTVETKDPKKTASRVMSWLEMVMTDELVLSFRNTPDVTGFVGSHRNRSKPTPLLEEKIAASCSLWVQTVQEFDFGLSRWAIRFVSSTVLCTDYTGKITEIDNNKVENGHFYVRY